MSRWPITPLKGHISEVTVRKGSTPAEILSVTNANGFVRSLDVFDKQVFSENAGNYKLVRFNDLAYNPSRINVGSVARCQFPEGGAVSPMYVVVRCRESSLLPQFLLYFLKSDIGRRHIAHRCVGAVRFQLRYSDLERMEIPLPSLSEQERMVRILDEADLLLKLRQEANRYTENLFFALFEGIFGDGTQFPIKKKMSHICGFITKGTTPNASDIKDKATQGDIPFLKVLHITETGEINFESSPSYISAALHNGALARSKVYPGDVLMNIVGPPLGKIAIVPPDFEQWNINQALAIFRPREEILPVYLFFFLRNANVLAKILSQAAGVRQLNLSLEQCRNIDVPVPPMSMQIDFSNRVDEVRVVKKLQWVNGTLLGQLFESFAHGAFEGRL